MDNGLFVVVVPKRETPLVSFNLAYKTGSKNETPGKEGFAHLFEHLMFEGSKNLPKGEFDRACSRAGGENNAYTTYDLTSYQMNLPSNQLELGLWLESERMFNFEITRESFENQKKVVVEEILQTVENEPYGKWREVNAATAYAPECSYSWETHGKMESVKNAKIEDAEHFYRLFYKPSNACLTIVGDVDPIDDFELIEKYFNSSADDAYPAPETIFKSAYKLGGGSGVCYDSVAAPAVFLSFHFDGFLSERIFAAEMIAAIIGYGRSSRLYKSMVSGGKIASNVGAFVDSREFSSLVTFYATGMEIDSDPKEIIGELWREIERAAFDGFAVEECDKARNAAMTQLSNSMALSSNIADAAARLQLFMNAPEEINELFYKYKYDKIDLDAIAGEIFRRENSVCVKVLPNI